MKSFKTYYARNRQRMCANRRGRYVLAEPKPDVKDMYMKEIEDCLLGDSKARAQLMAAFKKQQKIVVKRMSRVLGRTVCKIAAKRLLNKGLHMRKQHAGSLLKSTRSVNALQIRGSEDFGVGPTSGSPAPEDDPATAPTSPGPSTSPTTTAAGAEGVGGGEEGAKEGEEEGEEEMAKM